ncbi:MAG: Cof-type HAD-IIB family hydrolase [Lachnospiraceae bacterium]
MIRLIAADMDGTLLNDKKELPADFFTILKQLKAIGIEFAAASGRQYYNLKKVFGDNGNDLYYIAENGAMIFYRNQTIYADELKANKLSAIRKTIRTISGAYPIYCGKEGAYYEHTDTEFLYHATMYYEKLIQVPDLSEMLIRDQICKIAIYRPDAETTTLPAMMDFNREYQVTLSAPSWVDIMNQGTNKGKALQFVQQHLNITFDESMVFGDYLNDLELLQQAYYSYAMENAHPELKKISRFTAPSNNDAGVTQILHKLLEHKKDEGIKL